MITLTSCPICGNSQINKHPKFGVAPLIAYEIMPGVAVKAVVLSHYSVCSNCFVIFQNPRLSDGELDKFYSDGFYRKTLNTTDEEKDKDEERRAKFDAEIIKKNIGQVNSHLDIGASRGYLLDEVGADVKVAVESDVSGVKVKGIKLYSEMSKVPQKSFDLVTAIHVLEHVPAPLDYLRSMAKLTGKTGHLVVEVPTWKSPAGPLRLAHLYHFEPHVLRHMCIQAGLEIIQEVFTPHLFLICAK